MEVKTEKRRKQERFVLFLVECLHRYTEYEHERIEMLPQESLNFFERKLFNEIKERSIIQVGTESVLCGFKVFEVAFEVNEKVSLEQLDEIKANSQYKVRFVMPVMDEVRFYDKDTGSLNEIKLTPKYAIIMYETR